MFVVLSLWAALAALVPQEPAPEPDPTPKPATWRFRDESKPVKVVVLAGSIGAFPKSYARLLPEQCANVEVRNLSQTGMGAWPLKQHFKHEVLENRMLDLDQEGQEFWLVYGGGINSIGMPEATNHHMKNTFVLAHMAGMKVVGLTITPWGDDDDKRFRGIAGLELRQASQKVVDFVMGRLAPHEALGSYVDKRPAKDGPWVALERPDVAVNLYDSSLRAKEAGRRDLEAMRTLLAKDRDWEREHAGLGDAARQAQLATDAEALADLPRWYLREELRSFDHIHPNADGHRLIATTMCPKLPASWGCNCSALQ